MTDSLNKIKLVFISFLLFLFILLGSLHFSIFDFSFYKQQFEENKVYNVFGVDKTNLETNILLNYFLNKNKLISSNFYNEKEKAHLYDVKKLIIYSLLLFLSLFIFLFYSVFRLLEKNKFKSVSFIFLSSSFFILSLFLVAFFFKNSFSSLFFSFHKIFFTNNFWLLNQNTDNLINLFPQDFFYNITKKIIFLSLFFGVVLFIEGLFLRFFSSLQYSIQKT